MQLGCVGRVSTAGGGEAGRPRSENENEARSIELYSTVTQSQLPFSFVAAFDGSEPKIEAGPSRLDWKCTNTWSFHST